MSSTSLLSVAFPAVTTGPFSEPAIMSAYVLRFNPFSTRSPPWQFVQRLSIMGRTSCAKLTVAPWAVGSVDATGSVATVVSVGAAVSVESGGSVGTTVAGAITSVGEEMGVFVA
jgi:hypothetical protein